MDVMNRKIRYRDRFYSADELQDRLALELKRLKVQLSELKKDSNPNQDVVERTYRDMIRQREELFQSLD